MQRQSSGGVYSNIHGFNQEEIKEKLRAFPGGSIDLLKQDSGIAVLTINNPSRMNAFSGKNPSLLGITVWICIYRGGLQRAQLRKVCCFAWTELCFPRRQYDGGAGGTGEPAGELDGWQRPRGPGSCSDFLFWIRPQRCQGDLQPTGRKIKKHATTPFALCVFTTVNLFVLDMNTEAWKVTFVLFCFVLPGRTGWRCVCSCRILSQGCWGKSSLFTPV